MTGFRFVGRGSAWRDAYAERLAAPEALLDCADARIVNRGSGRIVVCVSIDGDLLAVKLFDESSLLDRLEGMFVGSGAQRVARAMSLMHDAGLRAPGLVALLEAGRGFTRHASCVVSEWVSGAQLHEAWATLTVAERHRFARALGAYVRSLHAAGLYPQDTGSGNILALRDRATWQFVLVDLDRVRRYRRVAWRRRRHNLMQLQRSLGRYARPSEAVGFLRGYLGATDNAEILRVGAEIVGASERKDAAKGVVSSARGTVPR